MSDPRKAMEQAKVEKPPPAALIATGPNTAEARKERKRNLAAAILALTAFRGMSLAKAWKTLHPGQKDISNVAARDRARRVRDWYLNMFPPSFLSVLELNNAGRERLSQVLAEGMHATRFDRDLQKIVPDIKLRLEAAKLVMTAVGINSQGDHVKESMRQQANSAAQIDAGPKFKDPDEWYRQAMIVEERAQETYVQPED